MGVLDKFLDVMKLDDDDEEFENEEFFDDDEYVEEKPKHNLFGFMKKDGMDNVSEEPETSVKATRTVKPQPVKNTLSRKSATVSRSSQGNMQVRVLRPASADDSREIVESLCDGRTVLLNLEGQDLEVSQRIIDFTSGALFAIDGNLQKVGNYIFLLTPAGVNVTGDISSLLGDQFGVTSNF